MSALQVKLEGDRKEAKRWLHEGKRLLFQLKMLMGLGILKQDSLTRIVGDVSIFVRSSYGIDTIQIEVIDMPTLPPTVSEGGAVQVLVQCRKSRNWSPFFIVYSFYLLKFKTKNGILSYDSYTYQGDITSEHALLPFQIGNSHILLIPQWSGFSYQYRTTDLCKTFTKEECPEILYADFGCEYLGDNIIVRNRSASKKYISHNNGVSYTELTTTFTVGNLEFNRYGPSENYFSSLAGKSFCSPYWMRINYGTNIFTDHAWLIRTEWQMGSEAVAETVHYFTDDNPPIEMILNFTGIKATYQVNTVYWNGHGGWDAFETNYYYKYYYLDVDMDGYKFQLIRWDYNDSLMSLGIYSGQWGNNAQRGSGTLRQFLIYPAPEHNKEFNYTFESPNNYSTTTIDSPLVEYNYTSYSQWMQTLCFFETNDNFVNVGDTYVKNIPQPLGDAIDSGKGDIIALSGYRDVMRLPKNGVSFEWIFESIDNTNDFFYKPIVNLGGGFIIVYPTQWDYYGYYLSKDYGKTFSWVSFPLSEDDPTIDMRYIDGIIGIYEKMALTYTSDGGFSWTADKNIWLSKNDCAEWEFLIKMPYTVLNIILIEEV